MKHPYEHGKSICPGKPDCLGLPKILEVSSDFASTNFFDDALLFSGILSPSPEILVISALCILLTSNDVSCLPPRNVSIFTNGNLRMERLLLHS